MDKERLIKIIAAVGLAIAVAIIGFSIFWFMKTSGTKKQIVAMIAQSGQVIKVGDVAMSGFPLQQKITITNLEIDATKADVDFPNKYRLTIQKVEAVSGLFAGKFTVSLSNQMQFVDNDNNAGNVNFNGNPSANFSLKKGQFATFSYQDNGYKIIDKSGNVIFESAASTFNFESNEEEGGKVRNKISGNLKGVSGIDLFNRRNFVSLDGMQNVAAQISEEQALADQATIDKNASSPDKSLIDRNDLSAKKTDSSLTESHNSQATLAQDSGGQSAKNDPDFPKIVKNDQTPGANNNAAPTLPTSPPPTPAAINADALNNINNSHSTIKKDITFEIEYLLGPDTKRPAVREDGPPQPAMMFDQKLILLSTTIKKFEYITPLYTVTASGTLNTDDNATMPGNIDLKIKIDKFENLLTFVKTILIQQSSDLKAPAPANAPQTNEVLSANIENKNTPTNLTKNFPTSIADLTNTHDIHMIDALISAAVTIAKRNNESQLTSLEKGTGQDIAVFDVKQSNDKEMTINGATLAEIEKLFPASNYQDGELPTPTATEPLTVPNNAPVTAPLPTPTKASPAVEPVKNNHKKPATKTEKPATKTKAVSAASATPKTPAAPTAPEATTTSPAAPAPTTVVTPSANPDPKKAE